MVGFLFYRAVISYQPDFNRMKYKNVWIGAAAVGVLLPSPGAGYWVKERLGVSDGEAGVGAMDAASR